jgi:hypothetical protein
MKSVLLLHTVETIHVSGFARQMVGKYGKYHSPLHFYLKRETYAKMAGS